MTLVFDAKRHERIASIRSHLGRAYALAFSPDGKVLAVPDAWTSPDGKDGWIGVRLWDVPKATERAKLTGHGNYVTALAFAPDGSRLVSGDHDGAVQLWDVATAHLLWKLPLHVSAVTAVAFSPDGGAVVSVGEDERVVISNAQTGKDLASFRGHDAKVLAVAFADGGKVLLSADSKGQVRTWDFPYGKFRATTSLKVNDKQPILKALAFSPDGRLAAATEDFSPVVRVWDVSTGAERATLKHTELHDCSCLAFSPDGRTLISGAQGHVQGGTGPVTTPGEVRIWDLSKLAGPK